MRPQKKLNVWLTRGQVSAAAAAALSTAGRASSDKYKHSRPGPAAHAPFLLATLTFLAPDSEENTLSPRWAHDSGWEALCPTSPSAALFLSCGEYLPMWSHPIHPGGSFLKATKLNEKPYWQTLTHKHVRTPHWTTCTDFDDRETRCYICKDQVHNK